MALDGGGGVDGAGRGGASDAGASAGASNAAGAADRAGDVSEAVGAAGRGEAARDALGSDEGRSTLAEAARSVDPGGDDGDGGRGASADGAGTGGMGAGSGVGGGTAAGSNAGALSETARGPTVAEEAAEANREAAAKADVAKAEATRAAEFQTAQLAPGAVMEMPTAQPAVVTGPIDAQVVLAQEVVTAGAAPAIGVEDPRTELTPTTAAGVAALATGVLVGAARNAIDAARDRGAVRDAAQAMGVDPAMVEGFLAAEAHAWAGAAGPTMGIARSVMGMANPDIHMDTGFGTPEHRVAREALGLHELAHPGDFRSAVAGDPQAAARAQTMIEGALDAHAEGRLVPVPEGLAEGWVETFPALDEAGRRLGELPGFTPAQLDDILEQEGFLAADPALTGPRHTGAPPVTVPDTGILADPIPEPIGPTVLEARTQTELDAALQGLSPGERRATITQSQDEYARQQGWTRDRLLERLNPGRTIYVDDQGQIRSADKLHGHWELLDRRGKHEGSTGLDGGEPHKPADPSGGHDIRVR